jgi:hypothetical protein
MTMLDEFISILAPYDGDKADELSLRAHRRSLGHDEGNLEEELVEELYKHDELAGEAAERELLIF